MAATIQPRPDDRNTLPAGATRMAERGVVRALIDVIPFVLAAGLFLVVGAPVLKFWYVEYTLPESYYAHAPLIPLMCAVMLWADRKALAEAPKKPFAPGLLIFVPALAVLVFSSKISAFALMSLSFLMVFWSGIWTLLGSRFMKEAGFALGFLVMMMPFPGPVLNEMTRGLQQMSTAGAAHLLNMLTYHNVQTGYRIAMDNFILFVDVPCSGFKTLLALITFNAFFARMLDGSVGKRILLFIACLPLALLVNVVRITLIGIVGESISDSAAHHFHDYSGIITIVLGFILLFTTARIMGCHRFAGFAIF